MTSKRIILDGDRSTGHTRENCYYPPTEAKPTKAKRTFIRGRRIAVNGDLYEDHPCINDHRFWHRDRKGESTTTMTFVEGIPVLRQGDPITCWDTCDVNEETIEDNLFVN